MHAKFNITITDKSIKGVRLAVNDPKTPTLDDIVQIEDTHGNVCNIQASILVIGIQALSRHFNLTPQQLLENLKGTKNEDSNEQASPLQTPSTPSPENSSKPGSSPAN